MCKFASAQQADCELVMGVIEDQLEIAMVQFTDMNQPNGQQSFLGGLSTQIEEPEKLRSGI
ncbi:hypothetical protein LTR28_008201 [Elasticomyces elasticus]|nr:hypothetical protein LTR28_008201 [Elasticomyces elasticus]